MSIARTFPGVFIEEVPSGVRTVTGVPTAIAAFVGRTAQGPVNQPVILNNFGEFESNFGGLDFNSSVGYAVRDFFLNGGGQAVVVRLYEPPPAGPQNRAQITFSQTTPLLLEAANEGTWGRSLVVTIERLAAGSTLDSIAASLGVPSNSVFTLKVAFGNTTETHRHVTLAASSRRYDSVLATESRLIRARTPVRTDTNATNLPLTSTVDQTTGRDSDFLTQTDHGSYFPANNETDKTGVRALEKTDIFNILCIPPDKRDAVGFHINIF
jgi:phage tail sheath protein FI